ncbi:hypothetical protein AAG594_08695 [Citromicrobium bathyomarinum]
MSEGPTPETIEFAGAMEEMAGTMAQLILSKVSREDRPIESLDWLNAANGMIGAAYNLAKIGGSEALAGYVEQLRAHADTVEASLDNRRDSPT